MDGKNGLCVGCDKGDSSEVKMRIQIEFFKNDLVEAIDAGVYEIAVRKNEQTKPLYIGESVTVLGRCAYHLYQLKSHPSYFGFTKSTINDPSIVLCFSLRGSIANTQKRKKTEKKLIGKELPLSQSGISDRLKRPKERKAALEEFLNSC